MSQDNNQNILFVVNPVAGGAVGKKIWDQITDCLEEDKYTCEYKLYETTGENDKQQIEELIAAYSPQKVVAVGGDGTIKEVAEVLLGKNIPIGIVPGGSANGMATELNLPTEVVESVEAIVEGQVKDMDVIRVNDNDICLHLSDIGMNAQIVKYYEENGWRGKWGYLRGAVKMLLNRKHMQLTIQQDGKEIVRVAYMVVLANARMYGTNAIINPDGNVFDGKFEIVIVRRWSLWEILKTFFSFIENNRNIIETISTKKVNINVKKNIYFQVDGEYKGKHNIITAEILAGKLPVLLPIKK